MSIEGLEKIYNDYYYKSQSMLNISAFMKHTINTFKDQQDQIAGLRKELTGDDIDVRDIKEVQNLNEI